MTWVAVSSFDGLGQPGTATLNGGTWSAALVPLALCAGGGAPVAVAAAVASAAAGAGRGGAERRDGLPGDQPVGDPRCGRPRAGLADLPVADRVGTQRQYRGAVVPRAVPLCSTLAGAVLLMRGNRVRRADHAKYEAPPRRREAARRRRRRQQARRCRRRTILGCARRGPRPHRGHRGAVTDGVLGAATLRRRDASNPVANAKGDDGS